MIQEMLVSLESQEEKEKLVRPELTAKQESQEKTVLLVSKVHEDHEVLLAHKDPQVHKD